MGKKGKKLAAAIMLAAALTACGKESPKELYQEGLKLYEDKSFDQAEEKLALALSKNQEKAEYYIAYGMALIETEKFEEAHAQFDRAIIEKENQIVRENNKQAHRGKGIAYYEEKEYKKAAEEFERALKISELEELNLDILHYKANAEEQLEDYEAAIKTCEEILKQKKSNAAVYAKKARMEVLLGDLEQASEDFDEAIKLDSKNYDNYFGKYFMFLGQGKEAEAQAVLEKALEISAKGDEDSFYVAKIHFFQGQYPTAQIELADSLGKGFTEAAFYLGQICESQEEYSDAIAHYQTYIEAEPDTVPAVVYNQLGNCYMIGEEYEKALDAFQKGIALGDGTILRTLRRNEIAAYEQLKDFKAADEKAKAYVKEYPEDEEMSREADFIWSRADENKDKSKSSGE